MPVEATNSLVIVNNSMSQHLLPLKRVITIIRSLNIDYISVISYTEPYPA